MDDLIGRVVFSKSGRDKGKMMIVVQVISEGLVKVADGDLRKIETPKIKNIKHLQFTNITAEEVKACIKSGTKLENHIIRKNLRKIIETGEIIGKGGLVNG